MSETKSKKKSTTSTKKNTSKQKTNSKKSLVILLCLVLVLGICVVGGVFIYKAIQENNDLKIATERYVVVPYDGATTLAAKPNNGILQLSAKKTAADDQKAAKLFQWKEGEYTYYQFYVGHILNVPISYETPCKYDGNPLTITFSTSVCTSEAIEESLSICEEVTKSSTYTVSTGVTVIGEGGVSFLGTGGKMSVAASVGWEGSWSNSTSLSTSNTYTTAKTFTEETTYSVEYNISGNKLGYYRYTLFATTDVYAIARTTDLAIFDVEYAYCARPSTYAYAVDYSEKNDFNESTGDKKLELKAEYLEGLKLEEDDPIDLSKSFVNSYSYNSNEDPSIQTRTVTDHGLYGMNTDLKDSDKLDMSSLDLYRNNGHVFEFIFNLKVTEVNDGYQEFYLYNSFNSGDKTDSSISRQAAVNNGLVADKTGIDTTEENSNHTIVFRIPGGVVNSTMYTKFGASGHSSDDWIVANVSCTVNVYKATTQNIDSTRKTISSEGYYGIDCLEEADAIDLSRYAEFFKNHIRFTITFAVTMSEVSDGYQELYLYNNNTKGTGSSYADALANGLIGVVSGTGEDDYSYSYNDEPGADKTISVVYFSIVVDGDKLANTVYLRYGANGNNDDDWYCDNVTAYIHAVIK